MGRFCTLPERDGFVVSIYSQEGTGPTSEDCYDGIGLLREGCSSDLDGTVWILSDTCLDARQVGSHATWDCTSNGHYNESFLEESTLSFSDGVITRRIVHRRWEYRYLTDAETCGVASCAEVQACASDNPSATAHCVVEDAGGCRCFVVEEEFDLELTGEYSHYDASHAHYLAGAEEVFGSLGPPGYCRKDDTLLVYIPQWVLSPWVPCPADQPCPKPPNFDPVTFPSLDCVDI